MCKICGLPSNELILNKISYEKCPGCNFLAKKDSFIVSSEKEFERYQNHENDDSSGYRDYQTRFYEMIKDFLGECVLDYGCGNNHILSNILNEYGINSNYYDLYFYPEINYKNTKYDSIILEEVIEHLKDPISVLKDLILLLNDNGRLIIRTNLITDKIDLNNWWYLRDITHISFFEFKTFETICELLSLKIIYCNSKDLIILQKA